MYLSQLKDIREKKENALNQDFQEVPKDESQFNDYHEKLKQRNLDYFKQKAEPEDDCVLEGMEYFDLGSDGSFMACGGKEGVKIFLVTSKGPLENAYLERYKNVKGVKCIEDFMVMVCHGTNNDLTVLKLEADKQKFRVVQEFNGSPDIESKAKFRPTYQDRPFS